MPYPTGFISRGRGMKDSIRSSHYLHKGHRQKSHSSLLRNHLPHGAAGDEYAGGTANSALPNRRAKAPCLHEGYPTLPCGKVDLEYLNGPEVTKCGFERHSTWLFAYESSTSFPNLPTVPVAHHKQILNDFILRSYTVGVECSTCMLPILQLVSIFPYHQFFFFLSSVKNALKLPALIIRLVSFPQ